ncbi:MAG: anti-phage ZorAB system protein ZorA [Candidatus Heimdallarchaeaceae archaeon]
MNEVINNLGKIYGAPFYILGGDFTFTNLYAFILLMIFIFCLLHFLLLKYSSIISNIKDGIEIFRNTNPQNVKPEEIGERLDDNPSLKDAWREFRETLINEQEYNKIVCPIDAKNFFHNNRIISLNRRFYNALPGIFTGAGILGTFLGLVFGIQGFDSGNAEEIRQGVQTLLSGMAIAFSTSVWGISLSLLFSVVEKFSIGKLEKNISRLQDEVNRVFSHATEEYYLNKLWDDSKQQTAALKSFSTDLADAVRISMSEVVSKDLAPVMLELTKAVKELNEFKNESTADAIEKIVNQFRESLTNQTNNEIQQLSQVLDETASVITKIPNQFNSFIEEVKQSSITHQKELLEGLEANQMKEHSRNEQLQNNLAEFLEKIQSLTEQQTEHLEKVSSTMHNRLNESTEQFENNIQKQSNMVAENIQSILNSIKEFSTQNQKELTNILEANQMKEHSRNEKLNSKLNDFLDRIDILSQEQNQHLQQVSNEVQNHLSNAIETFGNNIQKQSDMVDINVNFLLKQTQEWTQEIESRLDRFTEQRQSEISKVQEVLAKAKSIIESSGGIIESANLSAMEMNDAMDKLKEVVKDFNEFTIRNQQVFKAFENTTQMFVSHADQYSELTQTALEDIKTTTAHTQQAWKAYEQKFGDIKIDIDKMFSTLQIKIQDYRNAVESGLKDYIAITRESLNDYLRDVDDQLAQSTNMLANAIETFSDGIEDLNDAMDKIRKGRH